MNDEFDCTVREPRIRMLVAIGADTRLATPKKRPVSYPKFSVLRDSLFVCAAGVDAIKRLCDGVSKRPGFSKNHCNRRPSEIDQIVWSRVFDFQLVIIHTTWSLRIKIRRS